MPRKMTQITLFFALVLSFTLASCVVPNPSFQYSREVDQLFETATPIADHTYYYRGSELDPEAVIAIDNRFTMTSKVWARVDINQKILDNWAFEVRTYTGWFNCPYQGVKLFTQDGSQVGFGYSKWTFSLVKSIGSNAITVYPPDPTGSCLRQQVLDEL